MLGSKVETRAIESNLAIWLSAARSLDHEALSAGWTAASATLAAASCEETKRCSKLCCLNCIACSDCESSGNNQFYVASKNQAMTFPRSVHVNYTKSSSLIIYACLQNGHPFLKVPKTLFVRSSISVSRLLRIYQLRRLRINLLIKGSFKNHDVSGTGYITLKERRKSEPLRITADQGDEVSGFSSPPGSVVVGPESGSGPRSHSPGPRQACSPGQDPRPAPALRAGRRSCAVLVAGPGPGGSSPSWPAKARVVTGGRGQTATACSAPARCRNGAPRRESPLRHPALPTVRHLAGSAVRRFGNGHHDHCPATSP